MLNINNQKLILIAALSTSFAIVHAQSSSQSSSKATAPSWDVKADGNFVWLFDDNGTWINTPFQSTSFQGDLTVDYKASSKWKFEVAYRDNSSYSDYWSQRTSTITPGVTYKVLGFSINPYAEVDTINRTERGALALSYNYSKDLAFLPSVNDKNISIKPLIAFISAAKGNGLNATPETYENVKMDVPLTIKPYKFLSLGFDPTFYYLPDVTGVKSTSNLAYKATYNLVLPEKSLWGANATVQYGNGSTDASYGATGFSPASKLTFAIGASFKWSSGKTK